MDSLVRRLFHELADLSPAERSRVLAGRQIAPDVRAEVESLLAFDTEDDHLLTGGVSEAAEEVLQDVMLSVWKNAAAFRGDSRVSTWLLSIARNRA